MRFDIEALVYRVDNTPDGFGGEAETLVFLYKINCAFTAYGETEQSKKYGIKDKQYFKVITLDEMPDQDVKFRLKINGKWYDPYSDRRFGLHGRQSIMVERMV